MTCKDGRFNTGNKLCSNDLRDLNDNSIIVDGYVNSEEDYVKDRFGVERKTIAGMEKEFKETVRVPDSIKVSQELGNSTVNVISQHKVTEEFSKKANINSPSFTGKPLVPNAGMEWDNVFQIANIRQIMSSTRSASFLSIADKGDVVDLSLADSRRPVIHFTGKIDSNVIVNIDDSETSTYTYIFRDGTTGKGEVTVKYKKALSGVKLVKGSTMLYISNGSSLFPITIPEIDLTEITESISLKADINSPSFTGKPLVPSAGMEWDNNRQAVNIAQSLDMSRNTAFSNVSEHVNGEFDLNLDRSRRPVLHFTGKIDVDVTVNLDTITTTSYTYVFRNSTTGAGRLFVKYKKSSNSIEVHRGKPLFVTSNGSSLFPISDFSKDISNLTASVQNTDKNVKDMDSRIFKLEESQSEIPQWGFTEFKSSEVEKSGRDVVSAITHDRTVGFNVGSSELQMTTDDGETWSPLWSFSGTQSDAVTPLRNGELMVTTSNSTGAYVWISENFRGSGELKFTKVHEAHSKFVKFPQAWSVFEHDNLILIIDYGAKAGMAYGSTAKVPYGENARYAYASLDYGKTWKTIFDLNEWVISNGYGIEDEGEIQAKGVHCHGIAFDKWWDRIWITFGDNAYNIGGTIYSDDFGNTWNWANKGKDSVHLSPTNSRHQNVGIKPMLNCILFGTDSAPNGVQRINRSQGKIIDGEYTIDIAYAYSDEEILTHLCQGIYQAGNLPSMPVFFAFGAEGASRKSFIVATHDGYNFELVWESEEANARGRGLRSIVAPTLRGNLISKLLDTVDGASTTFEISGKSPTYAYLKDDKP